MAIIHLTDSSFKKEVLDSEKPVLVDFWAKWCGPCKAIAPFLQELADEYDNRVKICKLDIDDNPKAASVYGVMSIPTLLFFENGNVSEQIVGALSKADLKKKIEAYI